MHDFNYYPITVAAQIKDLIETINAFESTVRAIFMNQSLQFLILFLILIKEKALKTPWKFKLIVKLKAI